MEIKTKICKQCGDELDLANFYDQKTGLHGKTSRCIECQKQARQAKKQAGPPVKYIPPEGTKICLQCGDELDLDMFYDQKKGKNGKTSRCIECKKQDKQKRNFKRPTEGTKICTICDKELHVDNFYSDRDKNSGLRSVCIECHKTKVNEKMSTFDGFLTELVNIAKKRLKYRNKDLEFTITSADIFDLYTKQNGKCKLSNKTLTYLTTNQPNQNLDKQPYNISIDRIDSTKGYTKDNVQLVCAIVNRMKNDFDQQLFIDICKKVSSKPMLIQPTNKVTEYKDDI